jgi:hypothetical protein
MFCPQCGTDHHAGEAAETEAETPVIIDDRVNSAEVEIARINADKEIRLARIAAGMVDAERDQELAHERGKAEALEQIVTPPEPEPEPEPIDIIAPTAIVEDEIDDAPPETEGSPAPVPEKRAKGLGMW